MNSPERWAIQTVFGALKQGQVLADVPGIVQVKKLPRIYAPAPENVKISQLYSPNLMWKQLPANGQADLPRQMKKYAW